MDAIDILGVGVHKVTLEEAVRLVIGYTDDKKTNLVVTANPEIIMLSREDRQFKDILAQAALVTADGVGLVIAGKILGRPLPQRVTGIDLVTRLFEEGGGRGLRFYFLGAAPGVAETAARNLTEKYPGLEVAGVQHGFFQESGPVLEQITQARPHILLVALGMGKQERWVWEHREALGVPVAIGVGGSFDVFAGKVRRAPIWMQRLGLEWLYRLLKEPWRYKRMLVLPKFLWRVWVNKNHI
ncbi:MAG: WecB/TagA/CpsF family glycosyltransferase [Clostridia bacterium]|nr:WecB/TagA/CpsF family glycosyltransferase [Clostridia bacterium]